MTLVLAIIAVLYATIRLRGGASGRPSKTRPGQRARTCRPAFGGYGRACMTPAADACEEYSDEELWSWGFSSREQFRAAEVRHYEESAHEGRGVSVEEWRRYHGFPLHGGTPKIRGSRVRPRMKQGSRSRRAPRRARPSRRTRPASRASGDPAPPPRCPARRDLLHEGGALSELTRELGDLSAQRGAHYGAA